MKESERALNKIVDGGGEFYSAKMRRRMMRIEYRAALLMRNLCYRDWGLAEAIDELRWIVDSAEAIRTFEKRSKAARRRKL